MLTACVPTGGSPTVLEPTVTPMPDRSAAPDAEPTPDNGSDADTPGSSTVPTPGLRVEQQGSDRLVVQTGDFNLFTVLPDGSDRVDLTDPDSGRHTQPTWSPDGGRIAWSRQILGTDDNTIESDRFDRSSPLSIDLDVAPFYLSWDEASSQIAYLAPTVGGIDIGVAEMSEDGEARRIDRGQPYFFSWGPDGDELFVHASSLRLDLVDFDGTTRIVEEFPAPFQAPTWIAAESTLVFADRLDGENYLVTTGEQGEGRLELATFDGFLTFVVSPDGGRVALQVRDGATPSNGDIITASFQAEDEEEFQLPTPDPDDPFADPVDVLEPNRLQIMGLYGGDPFVLTSNRVAAFYWAPNGDSIAWLAPVPGQSNQLQWWFFADNQTFAGPAFQPSLTFARDYLPFFDQYGQSLSFWSPNSDQIVYAGTSPTTGESGIWVQPATPGASPTLIAPGEFAAWSPTAAGGAVSAL